MHLVATDAHWQHSGFHQLGTWTVPCTAQVTPNAVQLGAASGQTSFSIVTPAGCGWTAPATSDFLTRTSAGSGTGPGQVTYDYAANPSVQPRSTAPEIAGIAVTVTQLAAPPAVVLTGAGGGSWGPLNYAGARYYHSQTGRPSVPLDGPGDLPGRAGGHLRWTSR